MKIFGPGHVRDRGSFSYNDCVNRHRVNRVVAEARAGRSAVALITGESDGYAFAIHPKGDQCVYELASEQERVQVVRFGAPSKYIANKLMRALKQQLVARRAWQAAES